jgi:hypothetical protein
MGLGRLIRLGAQDAAGLDCQPGMRRGAWPRDRQSQGLGALQLSANDCVRDARFGPGLIRITPGSAGPAAAEQACGKALDHVIGVRIPGSQPKSSPSRAMAWSAPDWRRAVRGPAAFLQTVCKTIRNSRMGRRET